MPFFKPLLAGATLPDRLIGSIAALIAIALTIYMTFPLVAADLPAIVAPLGASAVLVFAVPASPLAQPWPVIGGNVISTLFGVAAWNVIPDATLAAGVAVGGAILIMSLLRCLHPPGGAAALTAVIGAPDIHAASYAFAITPVGINSLILVGLGLVFHRMGRHSYPHLSTLAHNTVTTAQATIGFASEDIDAALADMHETFDISRDDLETLFLRAEFHAVSRHTNVAEINDQNKRNRQPPKR
ncbi:HPP family protein [Sphingomonas faeni]|uniref:HPP family protein n=1 Tax=Sphingomonas faeni TaxID=185950 RepID=UPI00334F0898